MRKSQATTFFFYFFIQENLYFVGKRIWENLVYIVTFALPFFDVVGYGKSVTPTPIQIVIGFVDAILPSKILDNRLRILTQILITMDYFFFFCIFQTYNFSLEKKSILIWAINFIVLSIRKWIEILAKCLFSFSIIVFNMKFLVILLIRKSICQENCLVHDIQVTGFTYCGIVFQTMYNSKICT